MQTTTLILVTTELRASSQMQNEWTRERKEQMPHTNSNEHDLAG